MMAGESNWAFNDVVRAAEFVGVSLDVLTDPTLTPAKALAIVGERNNDDDDDGGLALADFFEVSTDYLLGRIDTPWPDPWEKNGKEAER